jgi:hypothetical protein
MGIGPMTNLDGGIHGKRMLHIEIAAVTTEVEE